MLEQEEHNTVLNRGKFINIGERFLNSGLNILAWIPGTTSNSLLEWLLEA